MGFGKAVAAKPLDLLKNTLGKGLTVTARQHACGQSLAVMLQPTMTLPGGHRATQFIRLARRVAGGHNCQRHYLLLKQRHAECTFEYLAQFR